MCIIRGVASDRWMAAQVAAVCLLVGVPELHCVCAVGAFLMTLSDQ